MPPLASWPRYLDIGACGALVILALVLLWFRPEMPTPIDDFGNYRGFYERLPNNSFGWGSLCFVWLAKLFKLLGLSADVFLYSVSAMVIVLKSAVFLRARREMQLPYWTIAFLLLPAFFLTDYFEIRNAASQAFLLAALWMVVERRIVPSVVCSIIAAGFHFSALPFIPVMYFPVLAIALIFLLTLSVGLFAPDLEQLLLRLRGQGGLGENLTHPGVLKFLALAVGGYIAPLSGFLKLASDRSVSVRKFWPVAGVVVASLVFYVGLWLIPSVPDVLFHRTHRVGWFGLSLLLLLISKDVWIRWFVCVPMTVVMFGYYAYLNLDLSGLRG